MFKKIAGAALVGALFSTAAHAAPVDCQAGATSGRFVTVNPALVGGLCSFEEGNLDNGTVINSALATVGAVLLDKDTTEDFPSGDPSESFLQFTGNQDDGFGTWTVQDAAWEANSRLFIGFHFGGGGGTPDSFLVELAYRNLSGTFALNAISPARVNGLSNIYLFGKECTPADECDDRPPNEVPAPGALALLGLGLGGLMLRRSLRKQA